VRTKQKPLDIYARNNLKDILKNAGIIHGKTYNINIITSAYLLRKKKHSQLNSFVA